MKLDPDLLKYGPFYCEENIWHLYREDSFLPFERMNIGSCNISSDTSKT